jgi:hypothetical protein
MLLAVDPGLNACGCALFAGPVLVHAHLVRNSASKHASFSERVKCMAIAVADAHEGLRELAVEFPVHYSAKHKQKGRQEDLLKLAAVVGALLSRLGLPSRTYFPYDWKHQLPKSVTRRRVSLRLSPEERAAMILPAASLQHNVYDAIGIGLHDVGRALF